MLKLLVSAPGSGHGKTVLTCALLSALVRRGLTPCAFKCGPDYIDSQFHRAVPGVESRNLDLFLMGGLFPEQHLHSEQWLHPEQQLKNLFDRWTAGHASAVCEGAMGLYDGLGGVSDRTSAWHIARTLDLSVLLTVRADGAALTLAAVLRGLRTFRDGVREQDGPRTAGRNGVRFAGVILNDCAPVLCRTLAPVLEREAGIPVLGCLPAMDAAAFPSRYLGLAAPCEVNDLSSRLLALGETLEANADLDRLLDLCVNTGSCPDNGQEHTTVTDGKPVRIVTGGIPVKTVTEGKPVPIAVARDEAFSFLYPETLETLVQQGAEPVFFSPLHDAALPSGTAGLYLPGGYPERYASALAENGAMRSAIAEAVRDGMPTVAEGGGFLYLGTTLKTNAAGTDASGTNATGTYTAGTYTAGTNAAGAGNFSRFPMVGVLPGEGVPAGRLVRFGYAYLYPETDSLLFRTGERIPVHAFHHWDSTENGTAFRLEKPTPPRPELLKSPELYSKAIKFASPGRFRFGTPPGRRQSLSPLSINGPDLWEKPRRSWREGYAGDTLYAGFPQLYFAGCPALAARFVSAAARYGARNRHFP